MADQAHDPIEARVITVSREALRADLLDLELRITKVITEGLSRKADASYVSSVEARVAQMERDAVRRDGPDMRRVGEQIVALTGAVTDLKAIVDTRQAAVDKLNRLSDEFDEKVMSETELRALIRNERQAETGIQWTWWGRLSSVILFLVTLAGFYLAYKYGQGAGGK